MRIEGLKVKLLLAERNLKQYDLAELSGISKATINSVLNGKTASVRTIYAIAKALNVPTEDILKK